MHSRRDRPRHKCMTVKARPCRCAFRSSQAGQHRAQSGGAVMVRTHRQIISPDYCSSSVCAEYAMTYSCQNDAMAPTVQKLRLACSACYAYPPRLRLVLGGATCTIKCQSILHIVGMRLQLGLPFRTLVVCRLHSLNACEVMKSGILSCSHRQEQR